MNNEKAKFEKVIEGLGYVPAWDGDCYLYEEVEVAWQAWQAAHAQGGQGADTEDVWLPFGAGSAYADAKESGKANMTISCELVVEIIDEIYRLNTAQPHPQPAVPVAVVINKTGSGEYEFYPSTALPSLPSGVHKAYVHPPKVQAMPDELRECLQEMVQAMHDYEMSVDEDAPYKHRAMMNRAHALLSTPAEPQSDEWAPYYEYPEIGKPVLGYHPDWVDEDFCSDGVRECFTFGDGTEWQSARWDGYSDLWVVEDGAPTLWIKHPQPPEQEDAS